MFTKIIKFKVNMVSFLKNYTLEIAGIGTKINQILKAVLTQLKEKIQPFDSCPGTTA